MPVPVSTQQADADQLRKQTSSIVSEKSEKSAPARSTSSLSTHSEKERGERGIPVIGARVPMLSHAGDVQAPSPAFESAPASKHNPVYKPPNYGEYNQPGRVDRIERNAFALSSEDLSQQVMQTLGGPGLGTKGGTPVPDEEMAYEASERIFSPENKNDEGVIEFTPQDDHRHAVHGYGGSASVRSGMSDIADKEYMDELHAEGTPVLASDEVRKSGANTPYQHPAVTPPFTPHRTPLHRPASASHSRSRRNSGGPNADVDNIEEQLGEKRKSIQLEEQHEPLFPEDKEGERTEETPKRPSLSGTKSQSTQRFPSADVWEDAPSSHHLETTVEGGVEGREPPLTEQDEESARLPVVPRSGTATPSHQPPPSHPKKHENNLLPHRPHLHTDGSSRLSQQKSFPSKDTWEEAPDSHHLETEVKDEPKKNDADEEEPSSSATAEAKPSAPPKAASPVEKKKPPIPPRPAKKPTGILGKAKSSLMDKASFLSDLNSRLAAGPPAPKPEKKEDEKPKEKEVLVDPRKSRARGPARRAPMRSEKKVTINENLNTVMGVWVVWEVPEEHEEEVASAPKAEQELRTEESTPATETEQEVKTEESIPAPRTEPVVKEAVSTERQEPEGKAEEEKQKEVAEPAVSTVKPTEEDNKTAEPSAHAVPDEMVVEAIGDEQHPETAPQEKFTGPSPPQTEAVPLPEEKTNAPELPKDDGSAEGKELGQGGIEIHNEEERKEVAKEVLESADRG